MNILNNIREIFSDDGGNMSSMRLLVFLVVGTLLFNWTWINITTGTIVSFDWADMGLILGSLFIKGYQKGKEK